MQNWRSYILSLYHFRCLGDDDTLLILFERLMIQYSIGNKLHVESRKRVIDEIE